MGLKSLELQPTKENLLNTLSSNLLDRNSSVWHFARFCDMQEGKCSVALDAKWGAGKTFFVKHVKMLIESFNPFTHTLKDDEKSIVKQAFSGYIGKGDSAIELEPAVCVYYDAWANDNDEDPILSLVYEIIKNTNSDYPFKKGTDCVKAAALIADFFSGKNVSDFVSLAKESDPLSAMKQEKEIHSLVEDFLESLLSEQGNRLIVFIDELDRCMPSYAVKLLERIKHYFENDRITFVFSINADELQHTIKSVYGEGFDACRYLDRFFDYRLPLPPANLENYYRSIGLNSGMWLYEAVCRAVIEYCSFSIREAEKFYRTAKVAAFKPTHDHRGFGFSGENGVQFSLIILVPILIGLKMKDSLLYNDFISGVDSSPLLEVMGNGDTARGLCNSLLDRNETFDTNDTRGMTVVNLTDKLNAVYDALFKNNDRLAWDGISIGEYRFTSETKEKLLQAASGLSNYASYE